MSSDRAGAVLSLSNSDVQAYCDVQAVKLLAISYLAVVIF